MDYARYARAGRIVKEDGPERTTRVRQCKANMECVKTGYI